MLCRNRCSASVARWVLGDGLHALVCMLAPARTWQQMPNFVLVIACRGGVAAMQKTAVAVAFAKRGKGLIKLNGEQHTYGARQQAPAACTQNRQADDAACASQ